MTSILVVDDMAVFREPIAASLKFAGFETFCASDGEEALRVARANHPDVILLDASMPKMDGLTFLKHLRADPDLSKTRVILLTALSDKKHVLAAASLGVKDYLLKSRFRLADLLARINAVTSSAGVGAKRPQPQRTSDTPAAPGSAPSAVGSAAVKTTAINPDIKPLMTGEEFFQKIQGVLKAKTLSGVVSQVIALASSPRSEMSELATVISRDPMLSAKVLRAANSSAYANKGAIVTTIPDAIRKVGFSTVRNIASALGVFDCVPDANADGFNPIGCWQHSFAVAQLCERLASGSGSPEQAGLAYVVGLCHDLGDIFLRSQFGKEFQQVADAAAQTGYPKEQLIREMLGMSYPQMQAAVLKCMALPEAIREPIGMVHASGSPRTENRLASILWMAENYANAAMLASGSAAEVSPLTQRFCLAAVGNSNPACPDPLALRSEILSLTVMLAGLSAADEKRLMVPMFTAAAKKIWVARDTNISTFDPVTLAFESLAEVVVRDRLPVAAEAQEIDGLVILARSANAGNLNEQQAKAAMAARPSRCSQPIFAVASDAVPTAESAIFAWRPSASLSEIAAFIEGLSDARSQLAAA